MKAINLTMGLLLAIFAHTYAQPAESAIVGVWDSDKKDVKMETYKQGDKYLRSGQDRSLSPVEITPGFTHPKNIERKAQGVSS
jgi:hypothetical protein